MIAIAGGAAVLLLVVVLAVAGAFDGGDEDGSSDRHGSTTTTTAPADEQLQPITLRAVEQAATRPATALFGLATADQPFIDFSDPRTRARPQGKAYVLWLLLDRKEGFRCRRLDVSQQGSSSDRFPIPAEVLAFARRARS